MCPIGTRLAILSGLLSVWASADIVVFKNGAKLTGTVTHTLDGNIEIRMESGHMVVPRAEVEKILPEPPKPPVRTRRPPTAYEAHIGEITGVAGKTKEKLDALVRALGSGVDRERRSARRALIDLGKAESISGYLRAMIEHAPSLAADLADILAETDPKGAVKELERLIETGDVEYRSRAIGTLMGIDRDAGLPHAAAGLVDTDRTIRIASATALGKAKEKRATLVLIKTMRSGDRKVSYASRNALCAIWSTDKKRVEYSSPESWLAFWTTRKDSVAGVLDPAKVVPMAAGRLAVTDK